MTNRQKTEAVARIQLALGRSKPQFPRDVGLTDEEVEAMGNEGLLEVGSQPQESEGERFAIVSILPAGWALVDSRAAFLDPFPRDSVSGMIFRSLGKILWGLLGLVVAAAVAWLLGQWFR